MPRCILCDYSSELDRGNRKVNYNDKEKGFVCDHCETAIDEIYYEYDQDEEDNELGRSEVVEFGSGAEAARVHQSLQGKFQWPADPAVPEDDVPSAGDDPVASGQGGVVGEGANDDGGLLP